MATFFKKMLVWICYIFGFILCLGGVTAILGIPIAAIGYSLQRSLGVYVD